MQLYERKLSHFFAKSLFSLIAWTSVGDAKRISQAFVFAISFSFWTERGIVPIAQVFFSRRIPSKRWRTRFAPDRSAFPLQDLRAERRDQASTRSLLTQTGPRHPGIPDEDCRPSSAGKSVPRSCFRTSRNSPLLSNRWTIAICMVNDKGKIMREGLVTSDPERLNQNP